MALDDFQMPSFQDPDGTTYIWDSASKSYVKAPLTDKRPDQSHATGGDNDLFDPFQHTEMDSNPLMEGYMAHTGAWEDDPEGGHYYLDCPFCGSDRDYRESRLPGTSGGNLYHCGMCGKYSDPNMTGSKSYDDYHNLNIPNEADQGRQDCKYEFDGTDTDGTDWYRCLTHGELAPSPDAPCAGYVEKPYTPDNQPGDTTFPEDWGKQANWNEDPPYPQQDEVKCPNCGETTTEQVCPACQKDLTPEWNTHGQENEFFGVHPDYNDAKEFWSWPQNVPKKNEFNYDDSFPSMSLSKVANQMDLLGESFGEPVTSIEQIQPGDLLYAGSDTHAGQPNVMKVHRIVDHYERPMTGFTWQCVNLADPSQPRLPSDQIHHMHSFEIPAAGLRRADDLATNALRPKTAEALPMDDGWDDVFSGQAPMRTEVGKWILDIHGQMHIEHGMQADHTRIEQRDGLQPSHIIALGSVYNDGSADVQSVPRPDMLNLDEAQGLLEQAFGAVMLQPPIGIHEVQEQIFPPTDLQGGQWFIPPHTGTITGIAWVKERPEDSQYQPNMVLCAEHLRPEDFALWSKGAAAIITAVGGGASHAAMLAATHNIPVITALGDSYNKLQTGNYLKIEPTSETITVMPGATGEMSSGQKHQIWNDILDYQRQRGGSVSKPFYLTSYHEEVLANSPSLEECPECRAPMFDRDGEAQCGDCGHKQPIIHSAGAAALAAPELLGAGEAAGAGGAGGGIGGVGKLMNGALGRGMAFQMGQNMVGDAGGKMNDIAQQATPQQFDPNAGTIASQRFAAENMRHEAVLSEIWALIQNALKGINWSGVGGALAANPLDDAAMAAISGSLGAAHQHATQQLQQATAALGDGDDESVGLATKNDGTNSTDEASNSGIEGKKEQGDGPEQLKDVDGGHDSQDKDSGDNLQADPQMQEKALKAFHMNLPLVIEFANSEEPGMDNPILQALDAMLEEAFPGYKDGEEEGGAESEHPQEKESETPEERDEDASEPDAKSEGSDKKEASLWHYLGASFDDYMNEQQWSGRPSEKSWGEHQDDWMQSDMSPGDVIAAYPDGTIVLDDGITTWNMERAQQFAQIHGWSDAGSAPGVATDPQMEAERGFGREAAGGPEAWNMRRTLDGPWDAYQSDPVEQQQQPQFNYAQPPQVQGNPEGFQQGAPTPYSCMNCGEEHMWPSNVNPRDLPACPQCGAQHWTRSGIQQTYATLDPGQQMGPGVPVGGGGLAMQMCPRCGQAHTPGSPCPVADVTTPVIDGGSLDNNPLNVTTKWRLANPSLPASQPAIAAGAQAAPATTCPLCGQNHIPGTPCPTPAQNQVQAPGATGPIQAPMSPGVQYSKVANDLASYLLQLGPGKHELEIGGLPFTIYYDEQGAMGDNGMGVPGDKTGEWEVWSGDKNIARVHVSPHGDSGYGNDQAPIYAAEQVAQAIQGALARRQASEDHTPDHNSDHSDYHSDDDWMDESGAPLEEGAQYEMKTAHSPIPTRITIEKIFPEKLTYLIHSGDVDYRDKITRDQLEMDGAKFLPVDDTGDDSMGDAFPDEELPVRPGQDALPQVDDISTPSTVMSGVDKGVVNREAQSLGDYTGSFSGDDPGDREWLREGSGSEVEVDPALMAKFAGKNYSPREQREFIDERGEARNLDRLDLAGTHYIDDELGTSDSLW